MRAHPLADRAASLRSDALAFLRSPAGHAFWSILVEQGGSFVMPAAWSALPRNRQIEALLGAETARIADGTTFAMASDLAAAARTVGGDQTIALPFTPDVLPAPAGILAFPADDPLMYLDSAPMIAVTWGPSLEGFAAGVHLTWWAAIPDQDNPAGIPMAVDFDMHLPFLPMFDTRLSSHELPPELIYSAVPLRTVVAAWYALTADTITLSEQRPQPAVTQALKRQQAKKRGVQVAVGGVETAQQITERAAQKMRAIGREAEVVEPLPAVADATRAAPHGVFDPELDDQLDADQRRIARIYREAAGHWHRLETQAMQRYPGVFDSLEELRAREHGQWKSWCWVPSERVAAWLVQLYNAPLKQAMWDGPRIAALGAWRSGGRHSFLTMLPLSRTAALQVPLHLPTAMPAPALGLVIDDAGAINVLLAAIDDVSGPEGPDAELVLITNYGDGTRMLDDVTKITLRLEGTDLREAVTRTQAYYDQAAVKNGGAPPPTPDEASYARHTHKVSLLAGLLSAVCAPGSELQDAGALTGRKPTAAWPPQPGLLPETTLWLLESAQPSFLSW